MTYRAGNLVSVTQTLLLGIPLTLALGACTDDGGSEDDEVGDTGTTEEDTTDETETADDSETGTAEEETETTGEPDPDFPLCTCEDFPDAGTCYAVPAGDAEALLIAANSMEDGDALVMGLGHTELDNQVTIRADGISVCGQGMGEEGDFEQGTTLDFLPQMSQSNGIDIVGDDIVVRDLAIVDAKKDGLRIEDSTGVTIQRVRVTWRNEGDSNNGAYGIYPVKVTKVLIEDSAAYNSSDAGIYVGQCAHAIVRNNVAMGNVAGIEIENTQYADVYGNLAEDNTGGLLIFDLPGNPIIGHDVAIHDNMIIANNRVNFAPGGTVKQIPPGTGTFTLASRRVEIYDNVYTDNGTGDIAILSGLVIEGDPAAWGLSMGELVGDIEGVELPTEGDTVFNYETNNIWVHGNEHSGGGTNPFLSTPDQELGVLLALLYASDLPIDSVLYDTIGESSFHTTDPAENSNDNHICMGDNPGGSFVSLNVEVTSMTMGATTDDLFQPEAPYTPFDCDAFSMGPIVPPDM